MRCCRAVLLSRSVPLLHANRSNEFTHLFITSSLPTVIAVSMQVKTCPYTLKVCLPPSLLVLWERKPILQPLPLQKPYTPHLSLPLTLKPLMSFPTRSPTTFVSSWTPSNLEFSSMTSWWWRSFRSVFMRSSVNSWHNNMQTTSQPATKGWSSKRWGSITTCCRCTWL